MFKSDLKNTQQGNVVANMIQNRTTNGERTINAGIRNATRKEKGIFSTKNLRRKESIYRQWCRVQLKKRSRIIAAQK